MSHDIVFLCKKLNLIVNFLCVVIGVCPGMGRNGDKGKPEYLTIIEWRRVVIAAFPRW